MTRPADGKLADHDGDADEQDAEDVDDLHDEMMTKGLRIRLSLFTRRDYDEEAAPVHARDIGKPPDVDQPHGGAGVGEDESHTGRPLSSHDYLPILYRAAEPVGRGRFAGLSHRVSPCRPSGPRCPADAAPLMRRAHPCQDTAWSPPFGSSILIEVDGKRYKRVYRNEQSYVSGAGEVRVDRSVYRYTAGDRETVCAMEPRAGIEGNR